VVTYQEMDRDPKPLPVLEVTVLAEVVNHEASPHDQAQVIDGVEVPDTERLDHDVCRR
jgi:hypothetical protein